MTRHHYGPRVHLLSDPYLDFQLAKLCSPETIQPLVNELTVILYRSLLRTAVNQFFPRRSQTISTRMASSHPEGVLKGQFVDPETKVVTVNLARAGTLPSHICYTELNLLMNPRHVRQDHISVGRTTNSMGSVTGAEMGSIKIGGPVDGALVLIPDPMGATGGTLNKVLQAYKSLGKPLKFVALHCIVTPEYLKTIQTHHPDLEVVAIRLDRGLSPPDVLAQEPGKLWDRERGLNDHQYIVPGGGGFGEILNNAEV